MKKRLAFLIVLSLLSGSILLPNVSAQSNMEEPHFSDLDKMRYEWAWPAIVFMSKHGIINGFPDGTFRPDAPVTRAELAVMFYKLFDRYRLSKLEEYSDQRYRYFLNRLSYRTVNDFSDIRENDWAYDEIATLYPLFWFGELREYDDNGKPLFNPDKKLVREDLARILYAAFAPDMREWLPEKKKMADFLSENLKDIPVHSARSYNHASEIADKLQKKGTDRYIIIVRQGKDVDFMEKGLVYLSEAIYQFHHHDIMTLDQMGRFRPDDIVTRAEAAAVLYGLVQYLNKIGAIFFYSGITLPAAANSGPVGNVSYPAGQETEGNPDFLGENGSIVKNIYTEGEISTSLDTRGYSSVTIDLKSQVKVDLHLRFNGNVGFLRQEELPYTLPLEGIDQLTITTQLRDVFFQRQLSDYEAELYVEFHK